MTEREKINLRDEQKILEAIVDENSAVTHWTIVPAPGERSDKGQIRRDGKFILDASAYGPGLDDSCRYLSKEGYEGSMIVAVRNSHAAYELLETGIFDAVFYHEEDDGWGIVAAGIQEHKRTSDHGLYITSCVNGIPNRADFDARLEERMRRGQE